MKRFINNFHSRRLLTSRRKPGLAPTGWSGFTLIEVVMAVAVVAIGLTAVLGLLPGAIQSGRNAADNTLSATIAQDIFSAIHAAQFTSVDLRNYGLPQLNGGVAYNLQNSYSALLPPQTTYFDQSGFNPATSADSYFRVVLNFQAQNPPVPAVLSVVTATVYWPAKPGMTPTPLNQSVFVTEIANYQ